MPPRLPSLAALRVFAVAGRQLSFKRAAEQLHVTPGAVSQQIRALEAELGVALFERGNRAVRLTPAGRDYLPELVDAFERIGTATDRLAARHAEVLLVSTLPAFASQWLIPRLGGFAARHPEIELRIDATARIVDFATERVDVAIRHGLGHYPGLRVDRLFAVACRPVCSPALLAGRPPIRRAHDLKALPLLHDELRQDWPLWFRAQGVRHPDAARGPGFSDSAVLLQAAIAGHGVALVDSALAAPALASRQLVVCLDQSWPSAFAYYCLSRRDTADERKIRSFRAWLLDQAAQMKTCDDADGSDAIICADAPAGLD